MKRSLRNELARTLIECELDGRPKLARWYEAEPWKWSAMRQQLEVATRLALTADCYHFVNGGFE